MASQLADRLLTVGYCLNVHPGEGWVDLREGVERYGIPVGGAWGGIDRYGLGLRLSGQAVVELGNPGVRQAADELFAASPYRPFTANAFPYGAFHGRSVKERVYAPDWSERIRLDYTIRAAEHLARWLSPGQGGSISTVPLGFRSAWERPDFVEACVAYLGEWLEAAARIEGATGQRLMLALEPEPGCFLETTEELVEFLVRVLFPAVDDEEVARRHVGICLDLCHAAVQFEEVSESLRLCSAAGIKVAKVQVSNALSVSNDGEGRRALSDFVEPVYLHQVSARTSGGEVRRWLDLAPALRDLEGWGEGAEVRVHFHVPLTFGGVGVLGATRDGVGAEAWAMLAGGISPHLEVETYTFGVLPEAVRPPGLDSMLMGEMEWLRNRLAEVRGGGIGESNLRP